MCHTQPVRRQLFLPTLAVVLSASVLLRADDLILSRFSDYLEALRVQAGIPGLAAVVVGSTDITYAQAFGRQDVDRNIPARTATPFQLDALTQMVVASLVLRCADGGWLSLDDRVGKFVPTSPDASATLRQILSHTTDGPNGLTLQLSSRSARAAGGGGVLMHRLLVSQRHRRPARSDGDGRLRTRCRRRRCRARLGRVQRVGDRSIPWGARKSRRPLRRRFEPDGLRRRATRRRR